MLEKLPSNRADEVREKHVKFTVLCPFQNHSLGGMDGLLLDLSSSSYPRVISNTCPSKGGREESFSVSCCSFSLISDAAMISRVTSGKSLIFF